MSYILFIVFYSYGMNKGVSVSEFSSKIVCERALSEAKQFFTVMKNDSKCIEVKK